MASRLQLQPPVLKRSATDLLLKQAVSDIVGSREASVRRHVPTSQRDDLDRLEYASDDEKNSSEEYDTDLENTADDPATKPAAVGHKQQPTITTTAAAVHFGRATYLSVCRKLRIEPISVISRGLFSTELVVSEHCLHSNETLALCNALLENRTVTKLVLDNNNLDSKSVQYVSYLLYDNTYIKSLSLANNGISSEGVRSICAMLMNNDGLNHINLSESSSHPMIEVFGLIVASNSIQDDVVDCIANVLKKNKSLISIDLSHNQIGDYGAKMIASAIALNEHLHCLDISWNCIRPAGGVAIGKSLQDNVQLKTLRAGHNGFDSSGTLAVAAALECNNVLTELDLTCNRIDESGLARLIVALTHNTTLTHLKIAKNPITTSSVIPLLTAILGNQDTAIQYIDMSTVTVSNEALGLIAQITAKKPKFQYLSAGVVSSNSEQLARARESANAALNALKKHVMSSTNVKALLKEFDKNNSGTISRQDLSTLLKTANVATDETLLANLISILGVTDDDRVNYGKLTSTSNKKKTTATKKRKAR